MTTYRLASSSLVGAPGLIAWAINGASFKRDRAQMINIVSQTWGIPSEAASALLMKQTPYTIEDGKDGGTVVFKV